MLAGIEYGWLAAAINFVAVFLLTSVVLRVRNRLRNLKRVRLLVRYYTNTDPYIVESHSQPVVETFILTKGHSIYVGSDLQTSEWQVMQIPKNWTMV